MNWKIGLIITLGLLVSSEVPKASAALVNSYQFNGKGNWSLDGVGSNNTPVGNISAIVPLGSKIEKAFLYSTTLFNSNSFFPSVNFAGTTYSGADWTSLGIASAASLQAFRTDVTSQIAAAVGGGSASPFTFSVLSENPNGQIDGEALAIVYSNPSELERTIAFLDGSTNPAGDSTFVNLADPLTNTQLTNPNFESLLSLGIGFGFQGGGQFSTVDVNGSRLTSAAGGQDDGIAANGALITIGGIGDSPTNPANPFATPNGDPRFDDELYTLTPFLKAGDTQIQIKTTNPSNDDNIFFAGINITAQAGVNKPPEPKAATTPEPSSVLGFLFLGGLGLVSLKRKTK
jgi:hypothetical protein